MVRSAATPRVSNHEAVGAQYSRDPPVVDIQRCRSNIFYPLTTHSIAAQGSLRCVVHKSSRSRANGMVSIWNGIAAMGRSERLVRVRAALARLPGHAAFWLKAFSQQTIDLTLRTHAGLQTRIVESPGLSLSQDDLDALVADLRTIAGKTLPAGDLTYGIFSGERERLSRAIVTLIREEATGRPIAFNALSVMSVELDGEQQEVTHLGLVMVDPDVQGQGLSWVLYGLTTLVLFARDGLRPKWISNVTQVPAVFGMVCETFSDVFPSPDAAARQSFAHLQLARGIMRDHRAVFGVGE